MKTSKTLKINFRVKIILASLFISASISSLFAQTVSTVATGLGSSLTGIVVDSLGNMYVSVRYENLIKKITPQGTASIYCNSGLNNPGGLAFDTKGNLYVANAHAQVSKIPPGGGPATIYATGLSYPWILEQYDGDTLIVQEYFSKKVYKVHPGGGVAGSPSVPLLATPPGGTGAGGVGVLPNKDLIICTATSFYTYRLNKNDNTLTQLSGSLSLSPFDISNRVGTDFYFGDYNLNIIYKLNGTDGSVTAYAGTGTPGGADGPIATAQFYTPYFFWNDPFGTIYLTEYASGKVRKISGQSSVSNITISGNTNVCAGSIIQLTASYQTNFYAGSTYTKSWSGPNGFTSNSLSINIPNANNTHSGYYVFKVTDINGLVKKDSVLVTVSTLTTQPGSISGNSSLCAGYTQTYSVAAVPGATSYTWTLPGGWTGSSSTNSINATAGANGGIITVTANNACGSSTAQSLSVTVNPSPSAPTISASGPTSFCTGGSVTLTSSSASGNLWNTGDTTQSITVSSTGSFTVQTVAGGCTSAVSAPINTTFTPNPTITTSGDVSIAPGGSTTLTASGATTYQWSPLIGLTPANGQGASVLASPPATTLYTVTGTTNGCQGQAQLLVTVLTDQPPVQLTAPVISPGTGTYQGTQNVTITTTELAASIYYTTNGNVPRFDVPNSFTKLYTGPIQITNSTTIRAVCVRNGALNSRVAVAFITINNPTVVANPVISPDGGTFDGSATVTINTTTPGATIYYTTNGSVPTLDVPNSFTKLYTGPFTLFGSATVRAVATKTGWKKSDVTVANFTINNPAVVAPVVFSPAPGNYSSPVSVSMSTSTPGATIYYTTNGNVPLLNPFPNSFTKIYSGPVLLNSSGTIRAIAVKSGFQNSVTSVGVYTITNGGVRVSFDEHAEHPFYFEENAITSDKPYSSLVYPNPSDGEYTLFINGQQEGECTVYIYSLLGTLVDKFTFSNTLGQHTISLKSKPSGAYLFRIQSGAFEEKIKVIKK
jgi:hypothetical protein